MYVYRSTTSPNEIIKERTPLENLTVEEGIRHDAFHLQFFMV
jgi:hypothetical protein